MAKPTETFSIRTFPYAPQFGGGYGWIIKNPLDTFALATSERASATPERAIAAAKRYAARELRGQGMAA